MGGSRVIWGRLRDTASQFSSLPDSASQSSTNAVKYLGLNVPDVWVRGSNIASSVSSPLPDADSPAASIMNGKFIAADIKSKAAREISRMKDTIGKHPGLAVVLVGERSDSRSFVRTKMKACHEVGIMPLMAELPRNSTEDEVFDVVSRLNNDPLVHGIIVQLPLPEHLDEERIVNVVSPEKDVDGFHPLNMGSLAMKGREPLFIPCAAKACIELLMRHGVELVGKNAVVIGRSKIVGLPTSLLLQRHHATVSVVHAFTKNPQEITCSGDIVVTDVGYPNLVQGNWLKPGSIVIDTGTNAVKDTNCKKGFHLTGDVCFEEAVRIASAITPVPGGLGPVTVSMLLSNTLDSAKRAYGFL